MTYCPCCRMGLKKGWELFGSCLSFLSPTKRFEPTLVQYLQDNMNNKNESVCAGAQFALNLLKRISGRAVRRNHGPDTKELEAIQVPKNKNFFNKIIKK